MVEASSSAQSPKLPLSVWAEGRGQPTLVFMSGGLCDHRSWMPQLMALSANYRVLAPDPRGCGASPSVGPYDITQQASDVADVIAATQTQPAVIISHSLGGYAALLLNQQRSDLVLANVFIDVPLSERGSNTSPFVDALHAAGSIEPLMQMVAMMSMTATDEVRAVIEDMMLRRSVEVAAGMLSNLEPATRHMASHMALAAAKPCLAIWPGPKPRGGDPEWLSQIAPSIQQVVLDDAGHFAQLEQPDAVNAHLEQFVRGLRVMTRE